MQDNIAAIVEKYFSEESEIEVQGINNRDESERRCFFSLFYVTYFFFVL